MTLANIMKLALRQLDEAAEDIAEYDGLFKSYANMGYMIAIRMFYRPREVFALQTDKRGCADIRALPIERVIAVQDEKRNEIGFDVDGLGMAIMTGRREAPVRVLAQTKRPPLIRDTDEPDLPEWAHPALADYICYRHLSSGSLAKQSRAEFFRQSFYQQMRALTPQGAGSVTRMKNLYTVTDARYRG